MAVKEKLTGGEAAQGYAIRPLPSGDAQPFSAYHDPRTGKVFRRLPADPYSVARYNRRGLRLGNPNAATSTPLEVPAARGDELVQFLLEKLNRLEAEVRRLGGSESVPEAPVTPTQLSFDI